MLSAFDLWHELLHRSLYRIQRQQGKVSKDSHIPELLDANSTR